MISFYGNRKHDKDGGTCKDEQRDDAEKVCFTHDVLLSCLLLRRQAMTWVPAAPDPWFVAELY